MRPASRMSVTADGLTLSTSPTSPRSTSLPSGGRVRPPAGAQQPGVLARQADRERTVLVEQADELAPDLAGEHHPDDLHDLGGRHPQAALELAGETEAREHGGDLRTAAVHDDRTQTGIPQEGDVLREGPLELVVEHGVAAVLDDDEGAPEPLEPGQRLDEGLGLGRRHPQGRGVDEAAHRAGRRAAWAGWSSCAVGRVLVDVVVGEVVGPDGRGLPAGVQVDEHVDLRDRTGRRRVRSAPTPPARHTGTPFIVTSSSSASNAGGGRADGGEDAPPVGVGAEDRRT